MDQKNILFFPEMRMMTKIFTRKFTFFLIDFPEIIFFFFSFFCLFDSCFCLFVCLAAGLSMCDLFITTTHSCFLELNIYMPAGKLKKIFHPANFRKQDYFFWSWCVPSLPYFLNRDRVISYTEHMTSNSVLW